MIPELRLRNAAPGRCAWCGVSFAAPAAAPHKRFCSAEHRQAWHDARRKAAEESLRRSEAEELSGGKNVNR